MPSPCALTCSPCSSCQSPHCNHLLLECRPAKRKPTPHSRRCHPSASSRLRQSCIEQPIKISIKVFLRSFCHRMFAFVLPSPNFEAGCSVICFGFCKLRSSSSLYFSAVFWVCAVSWRFWGVEKATFWLRFPSDKRVQVFEAWNLKFLPWCGHWWCRGGLTRQKSRLVWVRSRCCGIQASVPFPSTHLLANFRWSQEQSLSSGKVCQWFYAWRQTSYSIIHPAGLALANRQDTGLHETCQILSRRLFGQWSFSSDYRTESTLCAVSSQSVLQHNFALMDTNFFALTGRQCIHAFSSSHSWQKTQN